MVLSIIIGFEYKDSVHDEIPGTQYDILRMTYLCSHFSDKICVITDIKEFSQHVISDIEKIDEITVIIPEIISYKELGSVLNTLADTEILVYYTGHGSLEGQITAPTGSSINPSLFLDTFEDSDLFIIFDCCHPSTLALPFKLNNRRLGLRDEYHPRKGNILLLTGADEDNHEKAFSSRYGSVFTRIFFDLMRVESRVNKETECRGMRVESREEEYRENRGMRSKPTRDLNTIVQKIMYGIYEERNKHIQNVGFYTSKYIPH